jgi:hypothetical protein
MPMDKERVEDLVEHPHAGPPTAHTLEQEVNSDNSLQGYAAMNGLDKNEEIVRAALEFARQAGRDGNPADEDWSRAEEEFRRRSDRA